MFTFSKRCFILHTHSQTRCNHMTLEQALTSSNTVSKSLALKELMKHGVKDFAEFFAECGEKPEYKTSEVLLFLGY